MVKGEILILLTQMDSLTQNCGGSLNHTFSLGPMDTKQEPFWCFFIMAEGVILISVDTDGFQNSFIEKDGSIVTFMFTS